MDFDILQTKKELDALIVDFKRFNTAFRFVGLGVYIAYLIYSIGVGSGFLALNIFLLAISVAYLVFAVVVTVREAKGINTTQADKIAAKVYRYAKFTAVVVSAFLSIAGILTAVEHTTAISIVLAILLPVCLVLQLLFDLAIYWITARVKRFQAAFSQDFEFLKKDMVKLALGLVKDAVFNRGKEEKKDARKISEDEDGEIIIVGSDEPVSVKEMKRVKDGAALARENPVKKIFNKIFKGKKEKNLSSVPPEEDLRMEKIDKM